MNGVDPRDLALLWPELILVGAALALILAARRIRKASWIAAGTVLAALAAAAVSVLMLSGLPVGGPLTGFGEMIAVDAYSQFFKALIGVALALATLLSLRRMEAEHVRPGEYYALLLLASTGMMFAASAYDLLTLYLGLELTTLCFYILVGITVTHPTSNEAAVKYFLLGSFASALLLYGIALTYGVSGATDYAGIAASLAERGLGSDPILLAAIGLLAAGLAFKIAAVPFHAWAPDAYQGASAPVAAFLASASKAAGLAAVGRISLVALSSESALSLVVLAGLAGLSIIVGSVVALSQTDMKRLLAYSSISHAGYALLGLVSGTPEGVSATMIYAGLYVFMTLGAFGVVIALGQRGESVEGYRGLASQRPAIAALMLLFLLSLTGIPPTAGFVAKFVVILSAVRAGQIALAMLAVACSVISAFVYLRIAVLMYMREPEEAAPAQWPWAVSAALTVAALVTVFGGILPGSVAMWAIAPG